MPFDSKPEARPTSPAPFVPGHEGLGQLARLLRQDMPANFKWDFSVSFVYTNCGTVGCAYGLCLHLWPEHFSAPYGYDFTIIMARKFGLTLDKAKDFFFWAGKTYGKDVEDVTPVDVAQAIERYLAAERGPNAE